MVKYLIIYLNLRPTNFGYRNDSADRMQDLQSLVDQWSRNKDLTNPIKLKIYGSTITGKEKIQIDSQRCKKSPRKKTARSKSLPIPNTCPSK